MIIRCPKCGDKKQIGDVSRFATFHCASCYHKFKGFQAKVPLLSFALGLFNPLSGLSNDLFMKDRTWCPHCGSSIALTEKSDGTFCAPDNCRYCTRELDNSPAEEEDKADFFI